MANTCEYRIIVKGRKNACYAFFGSMLALDYKDIEAESGTDDQYELSIHGTCKWSVDSYCATHFDDECPVQIPEDPNEAAVFGEGYLYYVSERSRIFGVEVLCCSADIEEEIGEVFEHYNCGETISTDLADCPEELKILPPLEDGYERCCACGAEYPIEEMKEFNGAWFCQDCADEIYIPEDE